jgi:uncharacterized membrane protein YcaP (DUF421 family)
MWVFDKSLMEIMLRTALIYLALLIGLRLTGKKEVGQMSLFDLVLLLLIANAVQNAMTGPDTSLTGGIVAAGTLLAVHAALSQLTWRFAKVRHLAEGTPALLIHWGKVLQKNLAKEKVTAEEIHQALRSHGVSNVEDVALATLEIDGSISVLRKDEMPKTAQAHHHIRFLRKK